MYSSYHSRVFQLFINNSVHIFVQKLNIREKQRYYFVTDEDLGIEPV